MKKISNFLNATNEISSEESEVINGGVDLTGSNLVVETYIDDVTGDAALTLLMDGQVFYSELIV